MKEQKLSYRIIGCAMRVHTNLGTGYQELIYQRALELEFEREGLNFEREKSMPVTYRNQQIGTRRVDFFIEGKVMLELKAIWQLEPIHRVQTQNYCQMYELPFGLLINFGGTELQYQRVYNLNHPINIQWKKDKLLAKAS